MAVWGLCATDQGGTQSLGPLASEMLVAPVRIGWGPETLSRLPLPALGPLPQVHPLPGSSPGLLDGSYVLVLSQHLCLQESAPIVL